MVFLWDRECNLKRVELGWKISPRNIYVHIISSESWFSEGGWGEIATFWKEAIRKIPKEN